MSKSTIPATRVKTPREYEDALVTIIDMLAKVNVVTFASLAALPDLFEELCGALYEWAHHVAFPRFRYMAMKVETTTEDMASDWYEYATRTRSRAPVVNEETGEEQDVEEDPSHPSIDRFLSMATITGGRKAVAYMMQATNNYARTVYRNYWNKRMNKQERKQREEEKQRRKEHPEEQEKSLSSLIVAGQKAGVNPNVPYEACCTGGYENLELRSAMEDVILRMGKEKFLDATAILSDALGYERKDVARIIFRGKHVQLAVALAADVCWRLHRNYEKEFAGYIESARAFILPPHMQESEAALLRALYRATSSDKRAVFAGGNPLHQ